MGSWLLRVGSAAEGSVPCRLHVRGHALVGPLRWQPDGIANQSDEPGSTTKIVARRFLWRSAQHRSDAVDRRQRRQTLERARSRHQEPAEIIGKNFRHVVGIGGGRNLRLAGDGIGAARPNHGRILTSVTVERFGFNRKTTKTNRYPRDRYRHGNRHDEFLGYRCADGYQPRGGGGLFVGQ